MNKLTLAILWVALQGFTIVPASAGDTLSIKERYDRFESILDAHSETLSDRETWSEIASAYDRLFADYQNKRSLDSISDSDLSLMYRAAIIAESYARRANYRAHMALDLEELQARGIATRFDYQQAFAALVAAREFSEARKLRSQHMDVGLEPVPVYEEAPGIEDGIPTVLLVRSEDEGLLRRPVEMEGGRVVVVAHPLCHFSRNAAAAIRADPELGAAFENAVWLAPPDRHLYIDVFQQWNREHPDQDMAIAFEHDEWPMIDYWGTPTFYFLEDGKVSARVTGWPPDGHVEELKAGLEKIGLR